MWVKFWSQTTVITKVTSTFSNTRDHLRHQHLLRTREEYIRVKSRPTRIYSSDKFNLGVFCLCRESHQTVDISKKLMFTCIIFGCWDVHRSVYMHTRGASVNISTCNELAPYSLVVNLGNSLLGPNYHYEDQLKDKRHKQISYLQVLVPVDWNLDCLTIR